MQILDASNLHEHSPARGAISVVGGEAKHERPMGNLEVDGTFGLVTILPIERASDVVDDEHATEENPAGPYVAMVAELRRVG